MTSGDPLATKHVGVHPDTIQTTEVYMITNDKGEKEPQLKTEVSSKVCDLRYGTNPSQTAALYGDDTFLGTLRELKTGKQGPSQTNMEDIVYAALTVGYFDEPCAIIMKHENPSGFARQYENERLSLIYRKAVDADFRAAFGGTVLINRPIDLETAEAISELFTEVLVAPGYDEGVVDRLSKGSIRIFKFDEEKYRAIPRFEGDSGSTEIKTLPDGTKIRADALLTPIRLVEDLNQYIVSDRKPDERELKDLLTGYRIPLRSNSIRLVKNGYTTGLGTGQQDRVMCIGTAAHKNRELAELAKKDSRERVADYSIPGSCLISDGFFPYTDSIELANELGITAVLAPHGGQRFQEVLNKANDFGIAFVDLPGELRFFRH
ncbi:MAG: IMP cyclohydrolase [Candidatus Aenigmarchaeota archaeon]|nr:IMP cyclohydrolase [Candidatus Aenigmarchaeota archaeon]